jgi:hypothetical protein
MADAVVHRTRLQLSLDAELWQDARIFTTLKPSMLGRIRRKAIPTACAAQKHRFSTDL